MTNIRVHVIGPRLDKAVHCCLSFKSYDLIVVVFSSLALWPQQGFAFLELTCTSIVL